MYRKPYVMVGAVPLSNRVATVGRNYSLCFSVASRGLSAAYWLVEDMKVRANVTTITPSSVDNYVPPECITCSCMKKIYEADVRSGAVVSADPPGNSALTVSLYRDRTNGDPLRYLCDYPEFTLALIVVGSVPVTYNGNMQVELVLADAYNKTATQTLDVATGRLGHSRGRIDEHKHFHLVNF